MMDKVKRFMKSPALLVIMFIAAAGLIIGGSIGGAQAVINNYTDSAYQVQFATSRIGVELTRPELLDEFKEGGTQKFVVGKYFDQKLGAKNTGEITEYVRIVITRYWENKDGEKAPALDAKLIKLTVNDSSDWIFDEKYSTEERLVYYYTKPLAVGETTSDLLEQFCIDAKAAKDKAYDGAIFRIEAEADGVQTHNAANAINSAWGRKVSVTDDGPITGLD